MAKYIPYDFRQSTLVEIDFLEQLQPGTFEFAIHHLIEHKLDLSIFDSHYKNDASGRPAYNPAILLKIILFAYSKGITSSREIMWCCQTNIIFKALACDTVPHFTTIAHFVSGYPQSIEQIFEQVLLVCHAEGLLGTELFAIDGCKQRSNASKEWSGTFKELQEKRKKLKQLIRQSIADQQRLDAEGAAEEYKARAAQRQQTLDKAFKKIDHFLKTEQPKQGKSKSGAEVKSNITDNDSAKMTTSKGTIQGYNGIATVDAKHQIIVDAQTFGHAQEQHTLKPVLEKLQRRFKNLKINPDILRAATITADTGFSNSENNRWLKTEDINAYIPDNQFRRRDTQFAEQKAKYGKRHQGQARSKNSSGIFSSSDFNFDPETLSCQCPAGEPLSFLRIATDKNGEDYAYFKGRLSQCGNCALKSQCMHNPSAANHRKGHGRQVCFKLATADPQSSANEWMRQRIDGETGKAIYGQRLAIVEPVFANISEHKGLRGFSLRGQAKVQGQWQLYCLIHNIEKWKNYGALVKMSQKAA